MELVTDAMIAAIEVKSLEGLKREFDLKLPFAALSEEINKRLRKLQPRVRVAGFRPGKVPLAMVESEHGEQVFFEVANDQISKVISEILEKKALHVAGMPDLEPEVLKYRQDIVCKVVFEVFPEVNITDLTQLKVEQKQADLLDQDLNEFLLFLRRKGAKDFTETAENEAAAEGHQVDIHCQVRRAGEDKLVDEINDKFILDKWTNLPESIYANLIGMKAGEKKEVEEKLFGDADTDSADNTLVYAIELKACSTPVLPELNQDFFSSLGIKDADETVFRDKLRQQLEAALKENLDNQNKDLVFKAMLAAHEFPVPEALVTREARHDRAHYVADINKYAKGNLKKFKEDMIPLDAFLNKAKEKIRLSLIMEQCIKDYAIEPDQQKLDAYLAEQAVSYDQPEEFVRTYKENKEAYDNLKAFILEKQVVEKIIEKADINSKKLSYFEMMISK